jgi:hypothetical protein
MYCPSCGQEQISEETRFCSRCGLLLTVIAGVMNNNGALPRALAAAGSAKKNSPRRRGLKQGLFIFLLSFLVVPILALLTIAAGIEEPFAVVISLILLVVGGILRMVYAFMFEDDEPKQLSSEHMTTAASEKTFFGRTKAANALPPQQSIPASSYAPPKQGNWRETNDLAQPSVTEGTTKLLQDE